MNLLKNTAGFAARLLPSAGFGLLLVVCLCIGLEVRAVTYTKADTTSMNLPADWTNGLVPTATDLGLFDGTLSAPKAGSLSLGASLSVGGLVLTNSLRGPITIGAGNTLTLNGSGLDVSSANQNVAINCGVTVGASQTWLGGSNNLIIGGAIGGASGRTLTLGGNAGSTATISNILSVSSMLVKITNGVWTVLGDGAYAVNFELDGGMVLFPNRNCYVNNSGQTFTIHGGTWLNQNIYGLRLASTFGANSGGGNFTGVQDGGLVQLSVSSLELGNNSSGFTVNYTLSGGTLATVNNNFNIGSGTSGSTTTLTLTNTGKLFINGTLAGAQGAGAKQVVALNGGTFVVKAVNATQLSGTASPTVQGTLYNPGGTVAPGDVGTAGQINITGNYTQTNGGVLAIDLNGTTQANAFQNPGSYYDDLVVSGTATMGGSLAVTLGANFIPLYSDTYFVVGASNIAGAFTNVAFGSRVTTTGGEGSFLVTTGGKSVVLSQFTPTVWPSAPVVSITPASVTTNQGGATVFTANVTSATSCRYQWRFNGSPIAGANTPTMNVYNQPQNAGSYDVVVINPGGTAAASPVTLTVTPVWGNPAALIYHLDQTPAAGAGAITDATGQTRGTMVGTTLPLVVSGALMATSNAWDFASASAYLSVTSNPVVQSFGDYNQTPGLSFSFWVKMTNNLNNASVCALSGLFKVFCNGNGLTYYAGGDLLYNPLFSYALASIADGNWHHVVFTTDFRNNSGACYLDGVSQGALTIKTALATSSAPNLTSALNIGADAGGANQWKSGLDEFAIYTRCLSAAEVTQLYNASGITTNAGTTNYCALANPAPTVGVGATRMLMWTNGASSVTSPINAAASDLNGGVTYSWSTRTTPTGATVNYGNNTAASTTATLSAVGTYVLRCTVTDGGGLTDYDELTLIVASNLPPSIGVCQASQNILFNTNAAAVNLTAVVLDDGLPLPPGIVTSLWTQVSGPAPVSFLTPWLPNTPVTIPTNAGNYVLQLVAGDGLAFATNSVAISVVNNLPPVVTADAATHIIYWPTNATTLTGTVSGGSSLWTQVSGPDTATMANASALSTAVTFPAVGMYVFRLTASSNDQTNSATTYVSVWSPGAPQINAGSSRVAWLPNAVVGLQGSYAAITGAVSTAWSCMQGPANISFANPASLTTTATFTNSGVYRLCLTVTNKGGYFGQAFIVVEVYDATNNFGYTAATLNSFTNDYGLNYNYSDLAWSRLKPPPPSYVHPRILFNPEDVPEIRVRITNTISGPIVMGKIRTSAALITTLGTSFRAAYDGLAASDPTAFNGLYNNWANFVNSVRDECFRCLIDNDSAGGAKVAAALATLAEQMYRTLPGNLATAAQSFNGRVDWRPLQDTGVVYRDCIGWSYDFAYNFMNATQQASVRRTLALMTTNMWNIGMDTAPGFNGNCSNWIPLTGQTLLVNGLAIEGENGVDPNLMLRYQAQYDRMCSAYVFTDGCIYEGMGKGWIGEQTFWALARRGDMALATLNVRNHIRQYYLHAMETFGFGWTWDEMLGGNNAGAKLDDVITAKYLFPTDPLVDFQYRNAWTANYSNGLATASGGSPNYHPILQAICASDYNTNLTYTQAIAQQVSTNAPLSSFFNQRGLLITRSDWTTNGLRMMFQPRSEPGGHSEADRNMFNLDGFGRVLVPQCNGWAGVSDFSDISSVPRIDGVGPSTIPANFIEFGDTGNYTYGVGDASDSYSEQFGGTTTVFSPTYNSKLLYPISQSWANLPMGILPDWYDSQYTVAYWQPNTLVQRAFRTAGLVRGSTPYLLITDDLQKDNASHVYDWRMILPTDLAGNYSVSGNDIVFTSTNPACKLLARVLNTNWSGSFAVAAHSGQIALSALVTNLAPDYKMLILPFTNAAAPVTTTWSNNVLTVQMADGQKDLIYYTKYADGRTRVNPYRIGGVGLVLSAPTNLTATAGVASASLRWNGLTGATGYNVRSSLTSGGPYTLVAINVSGTNYVQTNIVSGTTYYFVVTALNTNGESMNSPEASAVPTGAPPVPTGLGANSDNTVIHLAWISSSGAAGYNVFRSLTSGSNYVQFATNWPATSCDDMGLVNGTTYYYVVQSVNALGHSANSLEISAVPNVHVPASLVWQGSALANNWDKQNPANLDWVSGMVNTTFWDGDSVTFNDSGYSSTPVMILTNVAPGGTVEVNNSGTYTFSGSGKITGSCSLQKDGAGTLTFLNYNDYTGTNFINSGTVQVGNSGGAYPLGGSGSLLASNTTLIFNTTTSLTNGSVDGPYGTVKNNNSTGAITIYQSPGARAIGTVLGVSGATISLSGDPASVTAVRNNFSQSGMTIKFGGGTWYLNGNNTIFAGNLEMNGGVVALTNRNGGQNFYMNVNGQVFTMHGGTLISSNQYGFRMGSTFNAGSGGVNFTGYQDGGTLVYVGGEGFQLGNNTTNMTCSYTLSGNAVLSQIGNTFNLGSGTNASTTTFTLTNSGKLSVNGTVAGSQGAGAQQVLAFNGGTLVASTINAANLRGLSNGPVNLLVNNGGALAPGDVGTPGKTTITGNYAVSNTTASLAIDLGGTTQANAFTNAMNNYDFVSVSGAAALNGALNVSLINNFVPATSNSFTILTTTSGGLSGMFTNVIGTRVPVANYAGGSFLVVTTATSVVLTNFRVLLASFTASVTNGASPLTVNFTDTSVGGITNRSWNFGDGFTTNTIATSVSHTFNSTGTNLVTLTVSASAGTNSASLAIIVIASSQPPVIGGISLSGMNLVITGTNGTAGANFYVLASTNVALPATNWTAISTNQFGPGGAVNFTNPLNPNSPQTFYRLRLP
ncbi:MAG: LamG-like jellyroll fold domain-containing protein [Verrucomicrobiota bacterium]